MITDYCRGDQDPSKQFKEYVKQRGYNLLTVKVSQPYFCPALFCYLYFMGLSCNFPKLLINETLGMFMLYETQYVFRIVGLRGNSRAGRFW